MFTLLAMNALKNLVVFLISGIMAISSFSAPVRTEPTNPNSNTGNRFLPDYGETLISAHRVGKGNAPENTLMAIENCLESDTQINNLEMDLQLTKDGRIVVFHDLFLDDLTDSVEVFGKKNTAILSKTYEELRQLNMAENFKVDGEYPYRGLRGDDIPDDLRIMTIEEVFNFVEQRAPGKFTYVLEVKYPSPWMTKIVDGLYDALVERNLCDRVIVGSFWNDTGRYIDQKYGGKLMRSANPAEIIKFYGSFKMKKELNPEKLGFMSLQLPYYWDDGRLLLGNLGQTEFIDYAHKYGISVQYWTVDKEEDARDLYIGGADMLMTDHPERIEKVINEMKTEKAS